MTTPPELRWNRDTGEIALRLPEAKTQAAWVKIDPRGCYNHGPYRRDVDVAGWPPLVPDPTFPIRIDRYDGLEVEPADRWTDPMDNGEFFRFHHDFVFEGLTTEVTGVGRPEWGAVSASTTVLTFHDRREAHFKLTAADGHLVAIMCRTMEHR